VPVNYVRTWDVAAPTTDVIMLGLSAEPSQAKVSTQYIDGLGRPIQSVVKQGSLVTDLLHPSSSTYAKDLVTPATYDEFGREQFKYLPFAASTADGTFKTNPFGEQQSFMQGQYGAQGDTFFYGQTQFEASPLNRMNKTLAPGNSWVGSDRGVSAKYWINTLADDVKIWKVTNASTAGDFGIYSIAANPYPAGELYKNVTMDEHGKQVMEFKDKEGKVILKKVQLDNNAYDDGTTGKDHTGWLCTYYIYDDLGQLRCVVQPKGVELLNQNGWNITALGGDILTEQCFRYEYDHRGRMTQKKVPGAAPVYMIYDARDRLVMTQDGNMRQGVHKWLVTKYDVLNRPIATYLWENTATAANHQSAAGSSTNYPTLSGSYELLTETHYDDYGTLPSPLSSSLISSGYASYLTASASAPDYAEPLVASQAVKGLLTWTKTKVLGENKYIITCNLYDEKGRVIQVQSVNYTGGLDVVTTQYSFSGQVLRSHVKHQKGGETVQDYHIGTKNNYDDLGRIVSIEKNINENGWKKLSQLSYDALGQLKTKKLSPDYNSGAGLETLTYDYNIRGWLLGANREYAKSTATGTNYFGFDLGYDKQTLNGLGSYAASQFNGNITGTVWKSKGDNEVRKYDFSYDAVNRLMGADFNQYSGGFNKNAGIDFTVSNLSYDANGNILSQDQKGWKVSGSDYIDQLRYTYTAGSNRLQNVIDESNEVNTRLGDFRSSSLYLSTLGSKTTANASSYTDYSYDENGNLIKDKNKDIETYQGGSGIEYNHLNLPQKITVKKNGSENKGTIEYVYDAAGNKLKKVTTEGTKVTTTLYIFGTYINDTLQFLPHEEGRARMVQVPDPNFEGPFYPCDRVIMGYDEDGYPILSECPPQTIPTVESFQYDYFLKDHLGNVRIMVTEEQKEDRYPAATMELQQTSAVGEQGTGGDVIVGTVDGNTFIGGSSPNTIEEALYNNIPATRTKVLNMGGYPANVLGSENKYAAKVNGSGEKIGPGIMLKVMSGDRFHVQASSWYKLASGQSIDPSSHPASQLITALAGGAANITSLHGASSAIEGSGALNAPVGDFFSDQLNEHTAGGRPKAYLNWVLLDERFNYVKSSSGADQVPLEGAYNNSAYPNNNLHWHQFFNLPVSKTGYLYVYVSNETPNIDVFFDNLQVTHIRGPILEETHYYPFGLTMAGISSKAAGALANKEQTFQEQRFDDDFGLNWIPFKWRNHDPQIGRFINIDPLADDYRYNTPYAFSENRVIDGRELEGLEYVSIHHYANGKNGIKMHYKSTDKDINKIHGTTAGIYNAASYGPQGKGVVHYYYNSDGSINSARTRWDNQRTDIASKFGNHGLYSGPGCITDRNGNYDFSFQPIDWADAIAKRHDMDYAKATATGETYAGYLEDVRTVQADRDMVTRVKDVLKDIKYSSTIGVNGVETPFRRSTSGEMGLALKGQLTVIEALATYKQWKIDNGYGNKDTYDKLRDKFKEGNYLTSAIIDLIRPKK
jgi:RHS repeat-associated protein